MWCREVGLGHDLPSSLKEYIHMDIFVCMCVCVCRIEALCDRVGGSYKQNSVSVPIGGEARLQERQ